MEQILELVKDFIDNKSKPEWVGGRDWIQYSGPTFDSNEYVNAVQSLLEGWFILGKKGREFEYKFQSILAKMMEF